MTGHRRGRARMVAVAAGLLTLLGPALGMGARAEQPAAQVASELRLDESPSLVLLRPFRHASGRQSTALARYLDGGFAGWLHRAWHTLDWMQPPTEQAGPAREERSVNPGLTEPQPARSACLEQLAGGSVGWPASASREHWFQVPSVEATGLWCDDETAGQELELAGAWVPAWLQQLDAGWATTLLATTGCGLGGPCSAGVRFPARAFMALWQALEPARRPPPYWECRERPLTIMRAGHEQRVLVALSCDGSIPAGALEQLSILARPVGVAAPASLPAEPDPQVSHSEWLPGIHLLHPRLMWVLHRVALAFPWHAVFIYSGYRVPPPSRRGGGHGSQHWRGRALDISVQGVSLEDLLALCAELSDVACGYYPNSKFVHFGVRARGHGPGLWVDSAAPGQPSHYLPSWPGVVQDGHVIWQRPPTWSRSAQKAGSSSNPRR